MTFEKTYDVQKDNRLIIKLPERFRSKKRVKVRNQEQKRKFCTFDRTITKN